MPRGKSPSDTMLPRKKLDNVKFKFSPQKKNTNKHNQVFVKEFKFGLLSLTLKKGMNQFINIKLHLYLIKLSLL
jgi:hypothetical protein